MIPLTPCQSNLLSACGFDLATGTLAVKFIGSDELHHYKDVPASIADDLQTAVDAGLFFTKYIRRQYEHEVIDGSAGESIQADKTPDKPKASGPATETASA